MLKFNPGEEPVFDNGISSFQGSWKYFQILSSMGNFTWLARNCQHLLGQSHLTQILRTTSRNSVVLTTDHHPPPPASRVGWFPFSKVILLTTLPHESILDNLHVHELIARFVLMQTVILTPNFHSDSRWAEKAEGILMKNKDDTQISIFLPFIFRTFKSYMDKNNTKRKNFEVIQPWKIVREHKNKVAFAIHGSHV